MKKLEKRGRTHESGRFGDHRRGSTVAGSRWGKWSCFCANCPPLSRLSWYS